MNLEIAISDELVEKIAQRAAEILVDRQFESLDDGYVGVAGAAEFLACPPSRIYSLVSAKRIPVHRDGSRLLFDRAELRRFVEKGGGRRP